MIERSVSMPSAGFAKRRACLVSYVIVLIVGVLCVAAEGRGQTSADGGTPTQSAAGTATRAIPSPQPAPPEPLPARPSDSPSAPKPAAAPRAPDLPLAQPAAPAAIDTADPALLRAYSDALIAYYAAVRERNRVDEATFARIGANRAWALENRQQVIERQQTIGIVVFAVAVLLVLAGVVFSGIQFYIAMRHARTGSAPPATTLKASLGSVEVSSSVLGVIILVISLLFFYLYLEHVFRLAVLPA